MVRLFFFGLLAGASSAAVCVTPQDEASLIQMQKGTFVHEHSHKVAAKETAFVQTAAVTSSAGFPGWSSSEKSTTDPEEGSGADIPNEDVPKEGGDDDKKGWMDSLSDAAQGMAESVGHEIGGDEYVTEMRKVVDQFSHVARKRMKNAQEELEEETVGTTAKEATAKASQVVADTGAAAADLAGQFCEQLRAAKQEVADRIGEMDSANEAEKPGLSSQLMPAISFLSQLTAGSADLMGSSVDELDGLKATPALQPGTPPAPMGEAVKPGTLTGEADVSCEDCVQRFADAGGCEAIDSGSDPTSLVPEGCHIEDCGQEMGQMCHSRAPTHEVELEPLLIQQDPEPDQVSQLARQALEQAEAALSMASSFAEQLSFAVDGEQALMTDLANAEGEDVGPLQQAVIEASRGVSLLLSGDFVAMESNRLAEEAWRAAAGPKAASIALPAVGISVWAAFVRV